jgi:hypothetical protein
LAVENFLSGNKGIAAETDTSSTARKYPGHFRQTDGVESARDRIAVRAGIDEEAVPGVQVVAREIKAFLRLRRQTALDFKSPEAMAGYLQ